MSFLVRALLFPIILGTMLSSCSPNIFSRTLEIKADDIPIYPNAHNITREGPLTLTDAPGISYIWKFTTNDTPEIVWRFYIDEMNRKWGFYGSIPQSEDKSLIVYSCPFYYLEMTSTSFDIKTYSITIKFVREYCY